MMPVEETRVFMRILVIKLVECMPNEMVFNDSAHMLVRLFVIVVIRSIELNRLWGR